MKASWLLRLSMTSEMSLKFGLKCPSQRPLNN